MNKFKFFKRQYQNNKFDVFQKKEGGIYWLKLCSISRKDLLVEFCVFAKIDCANIRGAAALFEHIYKLQPSEKLLDNFIAKKYIAKRAERKAKETTLLSELCNKEIFDWGGLYQNNLEKTIINNYVKILAALTCSIKR